MLHIDFYQINGLWHWEQVAGEYCSEDGFPTKLEAATDAAIFLAAAEAIFENLEPEQFLEIPHPSAFAYNGSAFWKQSDREAKRLDNGDIISLPADLPVYRMSDGF